MRQSSIRPSRRSASFRTTLESRRRRRVPPVEEPVDGNPGDPVPPPQLDRREQVPVDGVDAAEPEQAGEMQRSTGGLHMPAELRQRLEVVEPATADALIDADEILGTRRGRPPGSGGRPRCSPSDPREVQRPGRSPRAGYVAGRPRARARRGCGRVRWRCRRVQPGIPSRRAQRALRDAGAEIRLTCLCARSTMPGGDVRDAI